MEDLIQLVKTSAMWYTESLEMLLEKYNNDETKLSDAEKIEIEYLKILVDEITTILVELHKLKDSVHS